MLSAISSAQHIPERSMGSLIRSLARSLARTVGDGPEVGEISVPVHARAIAIDVVRCPPAVVSGWPPWVPTFGSNVLAESLEALETLSN